MECALGVALIKEYVVMEMKHILQRGFLFLSAVVLLTSVLGASNLRKRESDTKLAASHSALCDAEIDINNLTKKLSVEDWTEAQQTQTLLLDYSRRSPKCRSEVISILAHEMKARNLNFISDRSSYYLWLRGSVLLGNLKAVEALDLLIDHLDLNDGSFSASMAHQPAVLGIERMGIVAVPKLGVALQSNANRNVRLAAALCLVDIGGQEAKKALSRALRSEQDPCVRRLIQIAQEISFSELKSKITSERRSETDERMKLRRELLLAFKCDN